MLKVGLTGGIASGKSVVGEMFVALGAHLIQADRIAHELMRPGEAVYYEVISRFGREILHFDGSIDRSKLATAAFSTASGGASRIEELNRIVHPAVVRRQDEWMEEIARNHSKGVAIVEAALILEAGAANHFDRLIVVTCTEDQRAERFAARQHLPLEEARKEVARRMAAQLPDAEKIKAAHYVIDNSGALEKTREQVGKVWQDLGERQKLP
jgi:dephospho-CoA kinase